MGDETAGLLCSLYDVQQELADTQSANADELILEKIRQVSVAIERYVGQWLAPRPTNPASTTTLLFDVPWTGWNQRSLLLQRRPLMDASDGLLTGIRTFTSVGIATQSQPDTGGSYVTATAADLVTRGLRLEFLNTSSGVFYPGYNTVQIVGSFGPAAVPYDIQGVAIRAVSRRVLGKAGGGPAIAIGPSGTEYFLPDMSGSDRSTLDGYRIPAVA